MKKFYSYLLLFLIAGPALAQDYKYEATLLTDNDYFIWLNRTDRYYSYGIGAAFSLKPAKPGLLSQPFKDKQDYFISYGGKIEAYTPGNHQEESNALNYDRPFAGWLYGYIAPTYVFPRSKVQLALEAGILGPASQADEVQNWFHEHVKKTATLDWDEQVDNQVGINVRGIYAYELYRNDFIGLMVDPEVSIGNIFLYGMPRATLRLGKFMSMMQGGNTNTTLGSPSDAFDFYFDVSTALKVQAHNATLENGIFKGKSDEDTINNIIPILTMSLNVSYQRFFAIIKYYRISGQIEVQERHRYGSIGLSYKFN